MLAIRVRSTHTGSMPDSAATRCADGGSIGAGPRGMGVWTVRVRGRAAGGASQPQKTLTKQRLATANVRRFMGIGEASFRVAVR
jgi:hypothetical protein